MKISPVLITKNASATISYTLKSLRDFAEVIILDTGSTDQTIQISRGFKNVKIFTTNFAGFGAAKNMAAKLAKNDWILSIDADEVLSSELLESIKNESLRNNCVYKWQRQNYYQNRRIKFSGWGNESVTRLYNRNYTAFNKKLVHESLEVKDLKVKKLSGKLFHYSYHSISEFTIKRDFYSTLFALEYKSKRKSSPFIAFAKSIFDFVNTFVIKLAFLDGYRGLLIAVSNAHVTFTKYLKLYEVNMGNKGFTKNILTTVNLSVFPQKPDIHLSVICNKEGIQEPEIVKDKLIA
ncbi:MAG: glycosyltransferase family 2 protein [Bacteroidales bacterium]|nr:glycosyltransferase family 2 protein [Bacteroidales bacterium]